MLEWLVRFIKWLVTPDGRQVSKMVGDLFFLTIQICEDSEEQADQRAIDLDKD